MPFRPSYYDEMLNSREERPLTGADLFIVAVVLLMFIALVVILFQAAVIADRNNHKTKPAISATSIVRIQK